MPTQAPTKPPLREQFTLEGVEQLVKTFLDLQHNVFEAAGRFGLTLAELEEALAWPEARELLDRARRLSALRTQPALDLIFPCAIDRLASVMFDENAPAEARRKSAALLARICESRRRDRRPRPATAPPVPKPAAPPRASSHTDAVSPDDIIERATPAAFPRLVNDPDAEPRSTIEPAELHDETPPTPTDDATHEHDNEHDDISDDSSTPPRRVVADFLPPLRTFPLCPTPAESQPDTS